MTTTAMRPQKARPRAAIAARTLRTDRWWLPPLTIGAILLLFIVYSTVRLFMGKYYVVGDYGYLTPIYSPCLFKDCLPEASHFGQPLPAMPFFIPLGAIVFPFVGGFRLTCYYYRKAYYRSLWASPQACAVREPHKKYTGETRFPLIFQNSHRWFFYAAAIVLLINVWDALHTFQGKDGGFGIGLGTLIIWINVLALAGYTASCHACRHTFGGKLKHFSKHPLRYRMWVFISKLNPRHGFFAMLSLWTVMLTDFYIMAVSAGWFSDFRFFN
ncbi:hypothetical protein GCM10010123_33080 [Pilimelia anulata]|uniref:Succinate dehydrogenase n=1 Tax=Pilimelia anulata TaxID=53371 RepID=A0A8J3B886_9ACTN|nr:hypothetical protein [Pilimelia anulata]GGK00550.1 hypothetical protein GCM10010123_33080 [Pilimelia anulata]